MKTSRRMNSMQVFAALLGCMALIGGILALDTAGSIKSPEKSQKVVSQSPVKQQQQQQQQQASLALESNIANAKIEASPKDMSTAAGHHYGKSHGDHGKYYMYAESPKKGAYKMGFKRGNHKHLIERKEEVHKSHVHSYFKWHDKKGKGSHKFEFKHDDKKKYHHH